MQETHHYAYETSATTSESTESDCAHTCPICVISEASYILAQEMVSLITEYLNNKGQLPS